MSDGRSAQGERGDEGTTDPRVGRIIEALSKGRRVALESPLPIDRLAREVWSGLPESVRRKGSVATWAFGNANRFDLVALPRLAGVELDRSYLDPASLDPGPGPGPLAGPRPHRHRRGALVVAGLGVVIASGLAWRAWDGPRTHRGRADAPSSAPAVPRTSIGPEDRARIGAALKALADRLGVGGSDDPGDLMARIADQLHYRGPTLAPPELARLADEGDPDRDRALAWHGRIARTFADDRPLPGDFASLPLPRQLDEFARSFHLDPSPGIDAVIRELSREGAIRPTPLAARYPALSDYARFLGKLPRRE